FLTHDKDLVQLAGYHAYKRYENPKKIEVDGKKFKVIDTIYDTDSGLDALTVQNVKSGELTIVYVGSQQIKEDWLGTNAKLLSDTPPAQIEAAQKYFDDVTKEFGEVSSVTGNSLAGASANSVAVENPDVKAVTLNPAMLTDGMVDKKTTNKMMMNRTDVVIKSP